MPIRNYDKFSHMDVFKTGLIEGYIRNRQFLERQGIMSLADLFRKDDEHSIIYSEQGLNMTDRDVKTLITFARCKFLQEDLDFGIDVFQGHHRNYWFYTADEVKTLNTKLARTGSFLGNDIKKESIKDFKLQGIDIELVLLIAERINFGEEFSLMDIFTSPTFIEVIRRGSYSEIQKRRILIVSEYLRKKSIENERAPHSTSLEDEKKALLKRLAELEREKEMINMRLSEIDAMEARKKTI